MGVGIRRGSRMELQDTLVRVWIVTCIIRLKTG